MEGGDDRRSYMCRYCDKEYPCGKSLGGHLRSHRTNRAGPENDDVITARADKVSAPILRENPKKTWRLGGGAPPHPMLCKECGKGFQSMKALCGHMACHSDKREVLDSQSETDTSGPRRGKRSKKLRYKTLDFNNNNNNNNNSGSSVSMSIANGSSSVSEIEQEQQEEVAKCLMMLSRDSGYGYGYGNGKGLTSFAESSDNNSVVLDMNRNGFGFDPNSDSGYLRNGVKRAKGGVFVDGSDRDCGIDRLKLKNNHNHNYNQSVNYYPASRKIKDHELWEICHDKIENGTASIDESCRVVHKRTEFKINGCCDSVCESGENSIEADSFSVPFHSSTKAAKVNKNKSLSIKGYKKPSNDQDFSGKGKKRIGAKKAKCHECPICFRGFKSGQALGGHKRSHFMGRSEDRTVVVLAKQQVSGLLDLNLPAPDEEEECGRGGHAGFMAR